MLFANFQNNALHIYFDADDVQVTADVLKEIVDKEDAGIHIALWTMSFERFGMIRYSADERDYIYMKKRKVIVWLSRETIEYAVYKLENFIENHCFFPSEFCECDQVDCDLKINAKKKNIDIFFIKK